MDDLNMYTEDSKPIILELAKSGMQVDNIDELYNKSMNYEEFIPLLLKWIPITKNVWVKDSLIRAISVRWTKKVPDAKLVLLIEFNKSDTSEDLRWVIGNALEVISDDSIFNDLREIIENDKFSFSKQMVILALARMKIHKEEAIDLALHVLKDDKLAGFAITVLGKLKAKKALPEIQQYLTHENTWYRNAAKTAIKKINKGDA